MGRTRRFIAQAINLGMVMTMALMIWKLLICLSGSASPVTVVLTGSMEPGFRRGDILFVHMSKSPIHPGDIVVFNVEGRDIPIVHRVITVHERRDTSEINFLTKGDNNKYDDSYGIYASGQQWLQHDHILGRVVGFLPYAGWFTIILKENPVVKYLLFGLLAFWSSV